MHSGNRHSLGPSVLRQPSKILCPSGWMTNTPVLVKIILYPRLTKGPSPMRVWGKDGMICPRSASGLNAGTEASDALATDVSGSPFATLTDIVGVFELRFSTGVS